MKYVQNLLDWGDSLFRQDSREAITEAIQLYVLAFTLLGPRPRSKAPQSLEAIGNYEDLRAELNATSTPLLDFWVPQPVNPSVNGSAPPKLPFNPNRTVTTRFGVPENAQLLGFWDQVEDRLFKIRHSLNIDGIFRSLALFQPPINPAELVAAVAAAGGTGNLGAAIASSNVPVPHYRFSVMLEKTKEMIGMVTDFGGALLDALEKVDGEALSLLQNKQELAILDSLTKTKLLQKEQQEINEAGLQISLTSAQNRQTYYKGLFDKDLLSDEKVQLDLMISSTSLKAGAAIAKYVASVTGGIPDITVGGAGIMGSPITIAQTGGSSITKVSEFLAAALDGTASILDGTAAILGIQAGYERRRKEWEFQRNTADEDIRQIQLQIAAARNDIELAVHEIQLHEQTIAQTKEVGDFYRRKFSNKDLYNWMATRLSGLYFQAYRLAYDLAKQTERAFQFEFGTSDTFINFGYWDSRRRGLMAGEALRMDLARLEKSALDQDSRYLEITKIISLVRIDPVALLELRETGRCQFSLGELLFDRDFPGHYFRFIKSIALSIPAVVGPYQTIKATLTQTGHKTLMEPDLAGVQYLLGEEPSMPGSIRVDWRVNQQIAISTAVEDSGMFELNFSDDRYLPFEGTGVVSNWLLEMPKATNAIDFDTITDVIIHLRYSCKADSGSFRQAVMELDTFRNYRGVRLFSIAQEFSAQWFAFKNTPTNNTLELTLPPNTFPHNVKVDLNQNEISIVQIRSLSPSGDLPDVLDQFEITPPNPDAQPYQFTLKAKSGFDRLQAENLLVLLNYTGELLR
jgi:Tc toxin complex TcA C-terminal TcB-binding domain